MSFAILKVIEINEQFGYSSKNMPADLTETIEVVYRNSTLYDESHPSAFPPSHHMQPCIPLFIMLNWITANGWTIHTFNTVAGGQTMKFNKQGHTIVFQKTILESKMNASSPVDCEISNELSGLKNELDEMKCAMMEGNIKSQERKLNLTGLRQLVQSEISDVRTELMKLKLRVNVMELGEKAQSKKATSEAAKAALSASKDITLRLLMF